MQLILGNRFLIPTGGRHGRTPLKCRPEYFQNSHSSNVVFGGLTEPLHFDDLKLISPK